jgi:hypothetical protein
MRALSAGVALIKTLKEMRQMLRGNFQTTGDYR